MADENQTSNWAKVPAFFRHRPALAWGGTAAIVAVACAGVVALVIRDGEEPANVAMKCSVYEPDEGVRVSFNGKVTEEDAEAGCVPLAQKWSSASLYWRVGTPSLPEQEPSFACAFEPAGDDAGGIIFVETLPESFSSLGTRICGLFAQDGWAEADAPTGGPWVHEWRDEQNRRAQVEAEEQERWDAEQAEREAQREAVLACEERADARENEEIAAIEAETEARVEEAPESREYEIEGEGWEKEGEVWERTEAAKERCETGAAPGSEPPIVEPEGDFR